MAKKKASLKLSGKTRIVEIPRVKGKSYPRTTTPIQYSVEAVNRAVDSLMGMGFSEIYALRTLAYQMHENLVELKKFHNLTEGK